MVDLLDVEGFSAELAAKRNTLKNRSFGEYHRHYELAAKHNDTEQMSSSKENACVLQEHFPVKFQHHGSELA